MGNDPCGGERSVPELGKITNTLPTASNSQLFPLKSIYKFPIHFIRNCSKNGSFLHFVIYFYCFVNFENIDSTLMLTSHLWKHENTEYVDINLIL